MNASATTSREVTFWYGCNVLRHADLIRASVGILGALGFAVSPVGGPAYCCGTVKDANQTAAEGMALRTASRFNASPHRSVVAWCPSCLAHMKEFTQRAVETEFGLVYLTDVLFEHRDRLARLLVNPVPMRILIHKHSGFNDKSPVNARVPALLRLIPGLEVIEDDYVVPGYMCALLNAVPGAMGRMFSNTRERVRATGADAVVTIFHQCYRELCGLEAEGTVAAFNYIHLLARSMGIEQADEYKAWKIAGADAADSIPAERMERIGMAYFQKAILPELRSRPAPDARDGERSTLPPPLGLEPRR